LDEVVFANAKVGGSRAQALMIGGITRHGSEAWFE